jgi:ribose transport system substrate-binding protein
VVPYDAAVTFVRQGIKQAGSQAKVASFEGDPPVLKTVGDGTQVADFATSNPWVGWQGVDDLARLISKQPVTDVPMPMRLFTQANKSQAANWNGNLDFRAKYRSIWGK